ncbi:unnamed protein product [Ranitomeya imitator]|uniref:Uncharacterized protein n=1 Tax=Ranitomeya imitator TaxID=111125 RepID=A0ABN9M488_9NEOB|nr:unnamed protein product [Ranitomeya imitator]
MFLLAEIDMSSLTCQATKGRYEYKRSLTPASHFCKNNQGHWAFSFQLKTSKKKKFEDIQKANQAVVKKLADNYSSSDDEG